MPLLTTRSTIDIGTWNVLTIWETERINQISHLKYSRSIVIIKCIEGGFYDELKMNCKDQTHGSIWL
ncbi:unnamed protein product [Schistosoma margrebowiei]|uniref:Uncharacterized protein n=1 Tax=Schistosoma margrebowiei TaxID=48269 RepID=A0A183LGN4_9TREM|nr:unnamed protein product [Schistosoma margrebowiei]